MYDLAIVAMVFSALKFQAPSTKIQAFKVLTYTVWSIILANDWPLLWYSLIAPKSIVGSVAVRQSIFVLQVVLSAPIISIWVTTPMVKHDESLSPTLWYLLASLGWSLVISIGLLCEMAFRARASSSHNPFNSYWARNADSMTISTGLHISRPRWLKIPTFPRLESKIYERVRSWKMPQFSSRPVMSAWKSFIYPLQKDPCENGTLHTGLESTLGQKSGARSQYYSKAEPKDDERSSSSGSTTLCEQV